MPHSAAKQTEIVKHKIYMWLKVIVLKLPVCIKLGHRRIIKLSTETV